MATGITEVTQDPEKAGSALKVLSLRLRGMKGELEELGENVDENVESLSKMQTQVLNLTGGKVNIFNDDGSFKSTYEIMDGIAEIYDKLSSTDQANLLETIAGKNRANDVAALITNWEQVENAMKSAMGAEGSAAKENEKYMDSIQGHLDSLTASWQALSQTFIDSDFLKGTLDTLTALLDVLNFVIDKFGALPTLLGVITGALSFKNIGFFTTLNTGLDGAINKLAFMKTSIADISNAFRVGSSSGGLFGGLSAVRNVTSSVITKQDLTNLQNYNKLIDQGCSSQTAWYRTMQTSSASAQQLVINANGGTVALDGLTVATNTSRIAMVGLKVATIALNVALTMGLSFAIQTVITGLSNLINYAKNASEAADELKESTKQTAEEAQEESKQLDELISKYKELARSDIGDANTRAEIKSIQNDIVDLVGQQANNLDLVNGKLDEELAKLSQIQQATANATIDSNVNAYHTARESSDKAIGSGTGSWAHPSIGGSYDYIGSRDEEGEQLLKNAGLYGANISSGGWFYNTLYIQAIGDTAKEKAEYLQKVIDVLKSSSETYNYAASDLYNTLVRQRDEYQSYVDDVTIATNQLVDSVIGASKYNSELTKINVNSVETYRQYADKLASLVKNSPDLAEALENGDLTAQQIEQYINDYLASLPQFAPYYRPISGFTGNTGKSWNNYKNKAFAGWATTDGGTVGGDDSSTNSSASNLTFSELIADTDSEDDFIDKVNTYVEQMDILREAYNSFVSGDFSESDFLKLIEEFPELAHRYDDLDTAIRQKSEGLFESIDWEFGTQANKLGTEEARKELMRFKSAIVDLDGYIKTTSRTIDISVDTEGMKNLFTVMKESVSSTGLTEESIKKIENRYKELENYDAARLFERTSNGIHLNTKALRELEAEYEKTKKQRINDNLQSLIDQYNDLTIEIEDTSDAAQKAELYAQRAEIRDQINDVADLASQYEGLFSAFYKWEQAQSIGEEGDMYDSLTGGLEDVKELYQEGLIGTNKFRTAVQLMSNEDLSTASIDELLAAYDAGYSKMTRYFKDSSNGCLNFLNDVQNLNSEWVHMNEDGSWEINFGVGDDQKVADALGINVESVQAILRKLNDYGFDINLDSIYTQLELLGTSADEANEKLIELGKTDVRFNFDTDDINTVNDQINDAQALLNTFKNSDGTVNLSMVGAEEAQEVLVTLISRKQLLNAPSVLSVDTSNADSNITTTISLLKDFQTNYNDIEIETAVGADTTTAQTNIQDVLSKLDEIPDDIKAKLGLDNTEFTTAVEALKSTKVDVKAGVNLDQTALNTVTSTISSITPEMMVEAGLDSSLIDGYDPEDKEATVEYNVDDSKVKKYQAPDKYGTVLYIAELNSWTAPTQYGTIVYKGKVAEVNGTAHVRGTAFKNGDWRIKDSGVALGGELGQELIVRDGRYFTIGDDGAEFFKYQKDDIIFNHKQTTELLKNGKVTSGGGRGKALYTGTAFIQGNDSGKAFSGGTGSIIVNGSVKTKSSGSNSSKNNDSDDFEETFDWIEVAINRVEKAISNLNLKANSVYKSWSSRNKALKKEMSEIKGEISLQQQGYDRYMQQANSVGLSSEWKNKVKNGEVDIDTIQDEGLAEKLKEYQMWYNKAIDCKYAIDELGESLADCYQTAFDTVIAQYDGILGVIGHEKSMLDEYIAQSEAQGYITSSKYYEALIANEQNNIEELGNKKNELLAKLEEGLSSEAIEEGSEAWYSMVNQIDEVTLAIEEGTTAIIEYSNSIRDIEWEVFDLLQDNISSITQEADFLIDLMSNKDLHTDGGQLTNEGKATMGLHAQNYNVYMAQANDYAKEILDIDKELANDPYNQDLLERRQELLGLQQDNILAAEDEKQAIIDMVREGIELELNALQELVDTYEEALDSEKDLYEYQKKVAEQTKEIANLEKQMSAYAGDTSEETKAKIQQIKVSLEDAKSNFKDTQYDKYISDTKQLLDELYIEYEGILNQRLDNIDGLIGEMITSVNNNSGIIATTIYSTADKVGYTLSAEMQSIWEESYQNAQIDYQQRVDQTTAIVNQLVANGVISQEIANNILTTLANGDAQSAQATLDLLNQMVANGSIAQTEANNIITALSLGNQQQVSDSLKLLNQLVANGTLSQADANKIVSALVTGDAGAIQNANNIINQLVANGTLSQADANKVVSALNSSQQSKNNVVAQYGKDFNDKATTINNTLLGMKTTLDSMLVKLSEVASSKTNSASTSSSSNSSNSASTSSSSNSSQTNKTTSNSTSTKKRTEKEYYGVALAIWNGNYGWGTGSTRKTRLKNKGFDADKVQTIVNQMEKDGYVTSGKWVGKYHGITSLSPYHYNKFASGKQNINHNQWALTQEKGLEMVVRPSDGAILTPIAKYDSILNTKASDNIWNMANNPSDFIRDNLKLNEMNAPIGQSMQNSYTQNLERVVFNLPNVKNYDELLNTMKSDKNFERLIMAMTVDRMVGKTSLAKGKSIR